MPVRYGLVGYGRFGGQHADAIQSVSDAQLVCIAAHSDSSCARAAEERPNVDVVSDYRELLRRDDIDVVHVVVPTHLHFEIGTAVLEAGKNLMLEKPMTRSLQESLKLIEIANRTGTILAVGFKRRVATLWRTVKQIIDEGKIGTPLYAFIDLWRGPYRLGSGGWRYKPEHVGSWILEEPVHAFDKARWYLTPICGEPVSVYASASSASGDASVLTENFSAILKFASGAHVTVTQTLAAFGHQHTVGITGTEGSILARWHGAADSDGRPVEDLTYKSREGESPVAIPLTDVDREQSEIAGEVRMMIDAIRYGGPVVATGEDGAWSVGLAEACLDSLRSGNVIPVDSYRP